MVYDTFKCMHYIAQSVDMVLHIDIHGKLNNLDVNDNSSTACSFNLMLSYRIKLISL